MNSFTQPLLEYKELTRLWESIVFDKHLITNNKAVLLSCFYNPQFHHTLNDALTNAVDFIYEPVEYSEGEKNALSPIFFLQDIERRL